MGRQPGWMVAQTGRPAMRSPIRRDLERAFWRRIAEGMTSEDAAGAVGVSGPVGARWFRERGGMAMFLITPVTGRNLSSDEREVMALLTAQGAGVREIARQLGRHPSTVSRELRRNAATRGGKLEYRASVAQWKAELMARRPRTAKLVAMRCRAPEVRDSCPIDRCAFDRSSIKRRWRHWNIPSWFRERPTTGGERSVT
jgi:transposase